ncbi:MAG: response regulator transcription factor [Ruminococcaceae bacterium]|nr:response regulator transcription factor [Oscillospiraceae bacterium]
MDTIRIAVCNQSAQDLMQLLSLIRGHERSGSFDLSVFPELGKLFSCGRHFDVIFLEIGEGTPNGYDIACQMKALGDKSSIILVADDYRYAVAGYRVALRYLPKPLTRAAVTEALDAAICKPAPERFVVESGSERGIYRIGDICYVESCGHKITLHTMNGADRYYGTLRNVMEQLPQRYFVIIHKSLAVNLLYVCKADAGHVTLIDGTQLPIGPSRREEFRKKLNRFLGEERFCTVAGQGEGN